MSAYGKAERISSTDNDLQICLFKDKHQILQNDKKVKNTEIHIYEDVSKDTMTLRKSLWEEVLNYHCQGKFAYLNILSYII